MNKNRNKKIALAGNHATTIDLADSLIKSGYKLEVIINMSSNLDGKIAGYFDLGEFAKKNKIKIFRPETYSLTSDYDIKNIAKLNLDVLIVGSWQRLIPEWLLNKLSVGAFGMHGSWKPLPFGRGRSPGNWALILGKNKFIAYLFKYDSGADSGKIVAKESFELNQFDTIATYYHKIQLVQQNLIFQHFPAILEGKFKYQEQPKGSGTFLPKRTPEDGVIDWNWRTEQIYNLVRAITKPYPGAFTLYKEKKIMLWSVVPFYLFPEFKKIKPGSIITAFADGTFVVRTKDGALLIKEYETEKWQPKIGLILRSENNQSFEKLVRAGIITGFPLSRE